MARARNIKPSFFKDEGLGELPPAVRLLFAGLWCLADREGRLEDRPLRIKVEVLPYDNEDVDALLRQLAAAGYIVRYEVGSLKCIWIPKFQKHQRPHPHESKSELPAPQCDGMSLQDTAGCALPSSSLNPSSLNPPNPPRGEAAAPRKGAVVSASEVLAAWNAVPHFIHARGLTGKRLRCLQARSRDADWQASWRNALDKAASLPFLLGRNDRGWRATLDWFLRPDSVTKILEGVYDGLGGKGPPPKPTPTPAERAARIAAQRRRNEEEARLARESRAKCLPKLGGMFGVPEG